MAIDTPECIVPIWKGSIFLKQFFEHASGTRNADTTKVVLMLPVTTLMVEDKLSYSFVFCVFRRHMSAEFAEEL